jgi:hypothetical protein
MQECLAAGCADVKLLAVLNLITDEVRLASAVAAAAAAGRVGRP